MSEPQVQLEEKREPALNKAYVRAAARFGLKSPSSAKLFVSL